MIRVSEAFTPETTEKLLMHVYLEGHWSDKNQWVPDGYTPPLTVYIRALPTKDLRGEHGETLQAESLAEVNEVRECAMFAPEKGYRSIPTEDWKFYGVRLLYSQHDGKTPYAIAHPYTKGDKIVGFKIKLLAQKTMWNVGDVRDSDLYGWLRAKRIGGRTLYITEGEEDAIALRRILKMANAGHKDYKDYDYAVVSLPAGVDSVSKCLGRMASEIKQRFKQVVLAFDDDEPGRDGAKAALRHLPDALIARLPEVDANECLKQGRIRATKEAVLWQAKKPSSGLTLTASAVMDQILAPPQWGPDLPWPELNKLTFGQRKGELWSIGAGTGVGKTLIVHEWIAHNITKHGWKVLAILMEESAPESFKNVAGKIDNVPYHVPLADGEPERCLETLQKTVTKLDPYLTVWDITQIEDPKTTWAQITEELRRNGDEYDMVIVDNATTLTEGLDLSDTNTFLGTVASEYARFAVKFDFLAVILSHLNPPNKSSRSHENGGKVLESQFTGSRALQRYSHFMVGMERNKLAVDPNCSLLRVLKNRPYGRTGYSKTYYTEITGRLQEYNWSNDLYADKEIKKIKGDSHD